MQKFTELGDLCSDEAETDEVLFAILQWYQASSSERSTRSSCFMRILPSGGLEYSTSLALSTAPGPLQQHCGAAE